jgi:hypothetical protein
MLADSESAGAVRLTKSELAARWGCSPANVTKLFARPGAPAFGDDRRIALADAERWHSARLRIRKASPVADGWIPDVPADAPIEEARRSEAVSRAVVARVEALKARGEVIAKSDHKAIVAEDAAVIRAGLLALPATVASELAAAAAASGAAGVSAALARSIRALLLNWSRGLAAGAAREEFGRLAGEKEESNG